MLIYAPWLIWIIPFLGSAFTAFFFKYNPKWSNCVAVASIGLSALLSFSMIPDVFAGRILDLRSQWMPFGMGVLVDPLNVTMACVVSLIGLLVAIFSVGYMRGESSIARFWFLIQIFIGGYMVIVISGNLLLTLIGWEIVGLCCMALASFWYKDPYKASIGFKTGMILRVGDIALLMSILLIYIYAGTLNVVELQQSSEWAVQLSNSGLLITTVSLFLVGVMGKAAQFPLQMWLPDMLSVSPSSFNALTECLAGPYLLARLAPAFYNAHSFGVVELSAFFQIIIFTGLISALITALIAATQTNVFKIIAFSVSSVIGYMLTALGLAGLSKDFSSGYLAGTFLLTVDAFISGLLFLTATYISYTVSSDNIYNMAGFKSGLARRGLEVGIFALIGVPPLSGFWCTNWIQTISLTLAREASEAGLQALMFSGYTSFLLLIITSAVTSFYGLRMMWTLFKENEAGPELKNSRGIPFLMRQSLIVFLALTMIIDFFVPIFIPVFNRFFLSVIYRPLMENAFEVVLYIIPSVSTVMSIVALAIGAYLAHQAYVLEKIDLKNSVARHWVLKYSYKIFLNQIYLDVFYRKIAKYVASFSRHLYKYLEVEGITRLQIKGLNEIFDAWLHGIISISRWTYPHIELKGFETLNTALSKGVCKISKWLMEAHTGILSYNLLAALTGIILLFILIFTHGGSLGVFP